MSPGAWTMASQVPPHPRLVLWCWELGAVGCGDGRAVPGPRGGLQLCPQPSLLPRGFGY